MQYKGTRIDAQFKIDRIDPKSISPQIFFDIYVVPRKPVIFTSLLPGINAEDWTIDSLRNRAGKEQVKVEVKGPDGHFGTSLPRRSMSFSDFLEGITSSKTQKGQSFGMYLTTQYGEEEDLDDGVMFQMLHEYCPPPLPPMLDSFPHRPNILGNLIPEQVNLWVGSSTEGTSSGLHHDHHDNLYLLMSGKKQFTLFSPSDAFNLYTYGDISLIHPNGLINYDQQTRADGVTDLELNEADFEHWKTRVDHLIQAQIHGEELERAIEMRDVAADKLARTMHVDDDFEEIEVTRAALLEGEVALLNEETDEGDDGEIFEQDGIEHDQDGDEDGEGAEYEEDGMSDEELELELLKTANRANGIGNDKRHKLLSGDDDDDDDDEDEEDVEDSDLDNVFIPPAEPDHFSRIPAKDIHNKSVDKEAFPLFYEAMPYTFELNAGEMLFLPCGWFHEVRSFHCPESGPAHIAFNYWMHPPSSDIYSTPYNDYFLAQKWSEMAELISDIKESVRTKGKRLHPKPILSQDGNDSNHHHHHNGSNSGDEEEELKVPESKRRKMN